MKEHTKQITGKDYIYKILWSSTLLLGILLIGNPQESFAQGSEPIIRTAVQDDDVYVYHTLDVSLGEGFNIYRADDGENFKKLNKEPVRGAYDVNQFMAEVEEYMDLLMEAVEEDEPQMVYFKLQANSIAANLATFYYPDVAKALGKLYVDNTAPINSTATYKIEVVNDIGDPTGESLVQEVSLSPVIAPQPSNLQAEHKKREVVLTWKYPTSSFENDDKIVRFNIYDQKDGELRQLNSKPIIRINNFNEFRYVFNVPRIGQTLNLLVMPVDLTTKEGPGSEILKYTIEDNQPPRVIHGLEARPTEKGIVELTWPVSPEADAAGYNIYRADRIKGDYKKLNKDPIDLLETFYTDRPTKQRSTYFYRITAIDSSGNESEQSNAAKADVMDLTPPPAPHSMTAQPRDDGTVELQWEAPELVPDFKTYVITRRQLGRFAGTAETQLNQDDVSDTYFIDKGEADLSLAKGARYKYSIFAADSARNFSDTVSVVVKIPDLTPPEAPTRLTVDNDRGIRAILRWNASRSNDVSRYLVYRGTGNNEDLSVFKELSVNDRFMRDDSVEVGNTYNYAVSAVDSLGNEGERTEIQEFQMKDFTPPRAVRNVRATKNNEKVTITWEPVPTSDLETYRIYTSSIPTGQYELLAEVSDDETSYETANLDSSLWIRVRAVDSSGNESKPGEAASIYTE